MKTFDIALEYLKDVKFRELNTYNANEMTSKKPIVQQLERMRVTYQADVRNTFSNPYYRDIVWFCCIHHLADLAHERLSFFNVACDLLETEMPHLSRSWDRYLNTQYPKVIVEKFIEYCNNEMNPQPYFLSDKSEVRLEYFATAYHYIVDHKS